jgi:hypothetical protein
MASKPSRPIAEVVQGALLDAAMGVVVFVAEQQLSRRMGRKRALEAARPKSNGPEAARDQASA